MSEMELIASEYDTVFDLVLDIISVAADLHRSGKKIRLDEAEAAELAKMSSSNDYADLLASRDGTRGGYDLMDSEGRTGDEGQSGRPDISAGERQYVTAGVAYAGEETARDMQRSAAAPDRPRPVFEGKYDRRQPPRGTSVRAIEHGKNKLRISPITREGGTKKSRSSRKADEEEGDHMTMEERLVKCPGCGAEVSEKSVVCVSCGEFLRK